MRLGFKEHNTDIGVSDKEGERFGFVAMDGDKFIGCSSGLVYGSWLHLTDLWVEKPYRNQKLGRRLLTRLEQKVAKQGVRNTYTWTAEYEALEFYQKQGYKVFMEQEGYYPEGFSRYGLHKKFTG